MVFSPLVSAQCVDAGKCYPRTQPISRITIHHSASSFTKGFAVYESVITTEGCGSWNYAIDSEGTIGGFVSEDMGAWTSSSYENDSIAVTIEVANSSYGDPWPVSDESYKSLILLCTDICWRNNIKQLTYTGQLEGSNLTRHDWFALTGCPGPYLGARFPNIVEQVNNNLAKLRMSRVEYLQRPDGKKIKVDHPDAYDELISAYAPDHVEDRTSIPATTLTGSSVSATSKDAAETGKVLNPKAILDTMNLSPYIATISRGTSKVDFEKLHENKVVGLLIDAGCLYDDFHRVQAYRNPNLKKLVLGATEVGMPFGLYAHVRARSLAEANQEIENLRYCIYQYPPSLGLWLYLELMDRVATTDEILERYYKVLVELGLKRQVGLYATPKQLKRITWKSFYERFSLWLDDHVSSLVNISEAITPEFFVTGVSVKDEDEK